MRIATWNMKAVAPRQKLDIRREWLSQRVQPDITVLTEADLRAAREWNDWTIFGRREGLSDRQKYTTLIASADADLVQLESVKVGRRTYELDKWWPGTLVAADIRRDGNYWATLIGVYGVTQRHDGTRLGGGFESIPSLLDDIERICDSGRDRVILAGDFNLLPFHLPIVELFEMGLMNVTDGTAEERFPLEGCSGCYDDDICGHFWTHKNGKAEGNGKVQQLDWIYTTEALVDEFIEVRGGLVDFPEAWDYSDHAPIYADFD
jgi:exonuclease III